MFTPTTDDGDVETMRITVHNETGDQVGLNPYAWELGVESRPSPQRGRTLPITEDLESGRYALQIIVSHDRPSGGSSGDGNPQTGSRTECVALFEMSRS